MLRFGPGGVAWTPLSPSPAGPIVQPTDAPPAGRQDQATPREPAPAGPAVTPNRASETPESRETTSGMLPIITTPVDAQATALTSVHQLITGNTAISTGDDTHTLDLYPFFRGGSRCLWCPPGLDLGGLVLWGINKPGEYRNIQPPIPGIQGSMPTIVVGNNLVPSTKPNPQEENPEDPEDEDDKDDEDDDEDDDESSSSEPRESQPTKTQSSSSSGS
ncbi:MAG: hypothetical protein Q9183_006991, partial [Haloplaca sp. 2 TL-2023]